MKVFKRVLSLLMVVVLALAMVGLQLVRKANENQKTEEIQTVQESIRVLENEKSQLEKKLVSIKEGNPETTDVEQQVDQTGSKQAVLCVNDVTETFYKEIFPVMQEKGQTGIMVLSNGSLPGDRSNDTISVQGFLSMIEAGWSYAITVTKYSGNSTDSWKSAIDTYVKRLATRVGVTPTIYCFANETDEERIRVLQDAGFEAILSPDAVESDVLKAVQMLPYGSDSPEQAMNQMQGYCGLEVCAYWQNNTDAELQYSKEKMVQVLENSSIEFVGIDTLQPITAGSASDEGANEFDLGEYTTEEQIQARIAEIEDEIDQLYR